ncbi:MAG: sensor domain-containing diguanylate cyclase [Agathobacter sp.]|nr:sensor domain-containing diguanylate cyclase [Agathobacter sp.]
MESVNNQKSNSYTRIISIYLWICIVGLIVSIPIFNNMISKHDLVISNNMCGLIAEKMNNSITYITESVRGRAEILSHDKIDDWNELYLSLSENLSAEGCNSIGLLDMDNNLYGKDNENAEFEKWGLKEQAQKSEGVFFSAPYRQATSGKMVFTIFSPIYQEGERAGELFMTYYLEEIQDMANSNVLEDDMEIYLMNPYSNNYIMCFGADKTLMGSWNNTKLLYGQIETVRDKTYAQWEDEMRSGKNGEVVFFKMDGTVYTQVFVNIDVMKDWSVVVRIPNDALSNNLRLFNMAIMILITLLIASLFVLFILANRSANQEKKMLEYMSIHDPLTKLANRRAFESIYSSYLNNIISLGGKGALIFFDIDYFKQVNDGFGHAMGDRVLKEFSDISSEIFSENCTVSRFGGDEFIILIQKLDSRNAVEAKLDEFRRRLKELDFLVDDMGNVFRIHFSAGIVEVTQQGNSLDEVEKKADKALYEVKQKGRDGYAWYNG